MKEEHYFALVVRAKQSNDLMAFDQLAQRFRQQAEALALARLGDHSRAQDAVQEALLEAFLKLPELRFPAGFPGWLSRLVITQCERQRRAIRPTVGMDQALLVRQMGVEPEALSDQQQQKKCLEDAMAGLPVLERDAILLHYFGGSSSVEIAAFLEIPETPMRLLS
jgi:RNA polymerase sigma-70 factor, ECF subfamily